MMLTALLLFFTLFIGPRHHVRAAGFQVDWAKDESIRDAAKTLAGDTMAFYEGNKPGQTPGLLYDKPDPELWWWACGVLFGTMIEYARYTKDTAYNAVVKAGMVHQAGDNQDFLTPNWTAHMGNDDQGFWGLAAMSAAEVNFDNPDKGQPQWLATAQGVFNTMAAPERNDKTCGGGLRWQINLYSKGYNYKNSISNGLLFNLGARLAHYTGNKTYEQEANKVFDWERTIGFIAPDYAVFDGASITEECTNIDRSEWTYNAGVFLHGAAHMFNLTGGSSQWRERVDGLLDHMLGKFFPNKIAVETVCQNDEQNLCKRDSLLFKGVMHRWLADVSHIAPHTSEKILPVLQASAQGALSQCTGGDNGRMCGFQWSSGKFVGPPSVGMEISALSAVVAVLSSKGNAPSLVTEKTGGTSQGDSSAGSGSSSGSGAGKLAPITTASKVGASFLTLLVIGGIIGIQAWMLIE